MKLTTTLRIFLLTFTFVSPAFTAFAYDFMVNGIYYNKNGYEATVTYISREVHNSGLADQYYTYTSDYRGDVIIPETIIYNGVVYTVTAIGDHALDGSSNLTSISIPSTVRSVNSYAFKTCRGLKNLSIPTSVTYIGEYAFYGCSGLSYIILPDNVSSIGSNAFSGCSKLKTVVIGKSVTSISNALYSCPLTSIICLTATPPSSLGFQYNSASLYVPKESVELYRTTSGWNYFTNVYGFGNDSFSVPDNTVFNGDTIVIPVLMQNESEITAFQTDVYLPEGFEFVKNSDDEYQVSLSDRKGRDHVIMASDAHDGALRVLSYSPSLKPFKNNEGELFYITVKVPEDVCDTYPIWLRNTILTSTDEEELYAIDALSNVTVTNIIMGDVNADGFVTVTDVVWTAKYILFQNPEPFVFEAADMNGDGKITITDAVKIAHLVLDQDYDEPTDMNMRTPSMAGDRMSGDMANNGTVSINLDNAQEYTALQMDLTLPEGMIANEFALTSRASDLGLNVKDKGNGKVRVLAYSPSLKTIKGNDGAVLTFKVDGTMGEIIVDRIELVNTSGESYRLNGFSIMANNLTALDEMTAGKTVASVDYFNLAGQRMASPAAGVTLVVTTYNDGSRVTCKVIR